MATESNDWNANMLFCGSNTNPSPQILDWNLTDDVIAYGSNSTIHILNQSNGQFSINKILTGHTSSISCVRWLSYSNSKTTTTTTTPVFLLVTGSILGDVKVWEDTTLKCTQTIKFGAQSINNIAARAADTISHLAIASGAKVGVFKRNLEVSNSIFEELQIIDFGYHYVFGIDIAYLYIGTGTKYPVLACGSDSGKVVLHNISDFEKICDLIGHEDWVRNVEFCGESDDLYLATGSQDNYVRIWRIMPVIECDDSTKLKMKEILFHTSSNPGNNNNNNPQSVECLTVSLWYKQQATFLKPKFDQIRPKNDTFRPFIRLKTFQNLSALFS